jgi:hypothetical protein
MLVCKLFLNVSEQLYCVLHVIFLLAEKYVVSPVIVLEWGCNKYTEAFGVGGVGVPNDYLGFENCRSRNIIEHRRQIEEILSNTTQEARSATESLYDARYSQLLRLPYFDYVCFTVVDPMHNLFLGTAKHLVEVWLQLGL